MNVRMKTRPARFWLVWMALGIATAGSAYDAYREAPAGDEVPVAVDVPLARDLVAAPGDPAAVKEAIALDAAGNPTGAVVRLEAAILQSPDVPRLWEVLGLLQWKAGRTDEAIAVWTRYGVAAGDRPEPHVWLGEIRAARNELREALTAFDRALGLVPNDDEVRFQRTRIYRWLGHIEEAAETTRTLVARHPGRADYRRELAAALFANREYAEAASLWAQVRRDRPGDVDAELREIASRAYATGSPEALRDAASYLERYPNNLLALYVLADVAESTGRKEDALGHLRRILAVETTPKKKARAAFRTADLVSGLRELHPDRYSIEEAASVVRDYLGAQPYDVDVRLLLGELFIEDQRWGEARETFEKALAECNPQNIRACRGMFEVCVASGRHGEAGRWLERVRQFNPKDPYLWYLEARMEAAVGHHAAAFEALDKLERAGAAGAVAVLLYHGLGESDWTDVPSVRLVREQIQALKAAGYRFVSAHDLPAALSVSEPPEDLSRHAPLRVACVTWDDARRDAMALGTPLGRELNVPMTMHVPVGYVNEDHPFIAGWDALRACQVDSTWHFSSHAYDGHDPRPAVEQGHVVHPLANRLWIREAGRQETDEEYRARLTREYQGSRDAIVAELKRPAEADVFAYPFGDIGQLSHSNVTNAPGVNLEIAADFYKVGFIQSHFGHAVKGDNPLLFQRTEPYRSERGSNLVVRLLATHPVFLARATRAEMAATADKPYLANAMLALLERDGYPAEKLDPLKAKVRRMLGGSLFRWPFWRKTPKDGGETPETPAVAPPPAPAPAPEPPKAAAPAPAARKPAAATDSETLRPASRRAAPGSDDGLAPGEELRREAARAF